jgi:fructose-1,6-bisphosphatase/inositol monophosphatase family enzyme
MTFSRADLDRLADILAAAATSEIMPRFRDLGDGGIRQKTGALDLVTDADERAEWMIGDASAKAFPGALFVGEESVARDPSLLGGIAEADLAIIVDPVDGTSNFAWGLPLFGIMAAVTVKGETVAGLIYDPVGCDWLRAIRGEGASRLSATGGEESLRAAAPAALSEMTGCSSWYQMPEPMRSRTAGNLAKSRATFAYRCAAHEYRLVASGLTHFSLSWKLMPWDHAAGILIHSEAGGYSACLDGSPYRPTRHEGGVLSAPDAASWRILRDALIDG